MKVNNKGQVLVLFVLLIPIMLLVFGSVYFLGELTLEKQQIENISKIVIEYGLQNISDDDVEEKMQELFNKNNFDGSISLNIDKNYISLVTSKYITNIFSDMIGFNGIKIECEYTGYIDEEGNMIILKN